MIDAIEILKINKLSKTQLRIDMLRVLSKSKRPLTILDFKNNERFNEVNESSLYRSLNKFLKVGIIQSVPTTADMQAFEMSKADAHHHHHITCKLCHKIKCLDICEIEQSLKKMIKKSGYTPIGHSLEIFGICENCQH